MWLSLSLHTVGSHGHVWTEHHFAWKMDFKGRFGNYERVVSHSGEKVRQHPILLLDKETANMLTLGSAPDWALRPCLASPAVLGGSHFAAVTNPVLIILAPPQGIPVKWCQTTDGSLWALPFPAPTGQGSTAGTLPQAAPAAIGPAVTLSCGAAGGCQLIRAELRCLWKAAGHRLHPEQHSSPCCSKVCALYCFGLVVFLKCGFVESLLESFY